MSATTFSWRKALAVGAVANLASALPAGYGGDEAYYDSLCTPPGSPPSWVFAPAWAINNALTLWSNLRVANSPKGTPGRRVALQAEGVGWVTFASFSAVYFAGRSPILGAADTVAGLLATTVSVRATRQVDPVAALALVPRLAWLTYATYVAVGTASRSPDRLLGYQPRGTHHTEKSW